MYNIANVGWQLVHYTVYGTPKTDNGLRFTSSIIGCLRPVNCRVDSPPSNICILYIYMHVSNLGLCHFSCHNAMTGRCHLDDCRFWVNVKENRPLSFFRVGHVVQADQSDCLARRGYRIFHKHPPPPWTLSA